MKQATRHLWTSNLVHAGLLVGLTGLCVFAGEEKKEPAAAEKAAPAKDASIGGIPAVDATKGGTIEGKIVIKKDAKLPALKPHQVPEGNKDRTCCGAEVANESLILGPTGGVVNTVVSLDKVAGAPKPEKRPITLDNVKCVFVPHVQATTVGSPLTVTSQDPVLHSAMSLITNPFNKSVSQGQKTIATLTRPGPHILKCAVHGWMDAHVQVFPHDYFAVTGKAGTFKLEGVPPGEYKLKAWHEAPLQESTMTVKVDAGKTATVEIELKPYEG